MNILTAIRLIAGIAFVCAFLLVLVLPYWNIFRKAGFSPWLSLLIWVPLVNLIILYTVAYSDWKIEATASDEKNRIEQANVRRVLGWLFPWRRTFRRLELEKRWWHRLATVVFFVALIPMFLFSWAIASDSYRPANSYDSEIHQWIVSDSGVQLDMSKAQPIDLSAGIVGNPPNKADSVSQAPLPTGVTLSGPVSPPSKTIEMPDGKTATYPGTTQDETIKADWQHKLDAERAEGFLLGITIAAFVTVCFAYLLQVSYRALLYVIYGSRVTDTSDASERQTSTEAIS